MYQLSLQCAEKRFRDGVVVATPGGAHALSPATSLNQCPKSLAAILRSPVWEFASGVVIAAWLRQTDLDDKLSGFLTPSLLPAEKAVAQVEGWILGVRE